MEIQLNKINAEVNMRKQYMKNILKAGLVGLLCTGFLIIISGIIAARDTHSGSSEFTNSGSTNSGNTNSISTKSTGTNSSGVHSANFHSGKLSSANFHSSRVSGTNFNKANVNSANWHNRSVNSVVWHNGVAYNGYWHNGMWYRWHGMYWIDGIAYYYYFNPFYSDAYCEVLPDGYIVVPVSDVDSSQQAAAAADPNQQAAEQEEALPQAPPSAKALANSKDKITINIPNSHGGFTPVILKKYKNGYIGPQGEYYPGKPTVQQLSVLYGE